ncbi:hypothetical protein FNV43_RR09746 [Rhamnella rubrinervis]|uniref:Uncharacterized protein n=1 Tax=Rhamnella rubrinervis TaxID=2594499 RepID=A0A8K0HAL9_9ROSA|nr:hypothetical protein FNV43_RR09746 [Rhamnella rubrinervis]
MWSLRKGSCGEEIPLDLEVIQCGRSITTDNDGAAAIKRTKLLIYGGDYRTRGSTGRSSHQGRDSAFKDGRAALAVVVRDDKGQLFWLASDLIEYRSPREVEVLALEWTSSAAASR